MDDTASTDVPLVRAIPTDTMWRGAPAIFADETARTDVPLVRAIPTDTMWRGAPAIFADDTARTDVPLVRAIPMDTMWGGAPAIFADDDAADDWRGRGRVDCRDTMRSAAKRALWSLCASAIMWIILGAVMLMLRDTLDGTLVVRATKVEPCCCSDDRKCLRGQVCQCTLFEIDFVAPLTNETHTCHIVIDWTSRPSEFQTAGDAAPGSYEQVTHDCWFSKPLPAPTLAIIGVSITVALYLFFWITLIVATRCCTQ
jgi:hypothetical protein